MPRLFVAIDLPEEVKTAVGAICRNLPGARWVPGSQLHLTLQFIGEVEEKRLKGITEKLGTVKGEPFSLALKGVGHFPPRRQPRVLWAGMEESGALLELQKKVEVALAADGIIPDKPFSPHITIARLKESPVSAVTVFEQHHAGFKAGPFAVQEFYLYSSTLTRDGAIHRREAAYAV